MRDASEQLLETVTKILALDVAPSSHSWQRATHAMHNINRAMDDLPKSWFLQGGAKHQPHGMPSNSKDSTNNLSRPRGLSMIIPPSARGPNEGPGSRSAEGIASPTFLGGAPRDGYKMEHTPDGSVGRSPMPYQASARNATRSDAQTPDFRKDNSEHNHTFFARRFSQGDLLDRPSQTEAGTEASFGTKHQQSMRRPVTAYRVSQRSPREHYMAIDAKLPDHKVTGEHGVESFQTHSAGGYIDPARTDVGADAWRRYYQRPEAAWHAVEPAGLPIGVSNVGCHPGEQSHPSSGDQARRFESFASRSVDGYGSAGSSTNFPHVPTAFSDGSSDRPGTTQGRSKGRGARTSEHAMEGHRSSSSDGTGDDSVTLGGASNGDDAGRPMKYRKRSRAPGPTNCLSCGSSDTPEWRRGPGGLRTLCNACGLHFSKLARRRRATSASEADNVTIEELRSSLRIPAPSN